MNQDKTIFAVFFLVFYLLSAPASYAVSLDTDGDTIPDISERPICIAKSADYVKVLGFNRWVRDAKGFWFTLIFNKKFIKIQTPPPYNTFGCSCRQILAELTKTTDNLYLIDYLFGCSADTLKVWNQTSSPLETINIPINSPEGIVSDVILQPGVEYQVKASGTAVALDDGVNTVLFDAEMMSLNGEDPWSDGIGYNTIENDPIYGDGHLGTDLLDILIDELGVNWIDNTNHVYTYSILGTGEALTFRVNDPEPADNTGNIKIEIIQVLSN